MIPRQKEQLQGLYRKQKDLNRRLTLAGARLMEQEKRASLSMITAGLAHEINNPVNYLKGNLPFLKHYMEKFLNKSQTNPAAESPNPDADMETIKRELSSILADYDRGMQRISDIIKSLKMLFHKNQDSTSARICRRYWNRQ